MGRKSTIRSIRFSDELLELVDRQAGRNFTEKLENLVTRCTWELPKKEDELLRVQEQIREERLRLDRLRETGRSLSLISWTKITTLSHAGKWLK